MSDMNEMSDKAREQFSKAIQALLTAKADLKAAEARVKTLEEFILDQGLIPPE